MHQPQYLLALCNANAQWFYRPANNFRKARAVFRALGTRNMQIAFLYLVGSPVPGAPSVGTLDTVFETTSVL